MRVKLRNLIYYITLPFVRLRNRILCKKYPFLRIRFADGSYDLHEKYNITYLDMMPYIWKRKFGLKLCKEIKQELIRVSTPDVNWLEEYSLSQVKEKYGGLRWYDNGSPANSKITEIVAKYEQLSEEICIYCGKPSTHYTPGWITFCCEKCFRKRYSKNKDLEDLVNKYKLKINGEKNE